MGRFFGHDDVKDADCNDTMQRPAVRSESQYLTKPEAYELADRAAFDDLLKAGYTNQVVSNTKFLARAAMEGISRYPQFKDAFVYEVNEYARTAMKFVKGGGRDE